MTNANHAFGTTITLAGNAIGELSNIGGVSVDLELADVSTHSSANAYRERIGGMLNAGEVSIEGFFYPGDTNGQVALRTLQESRATGAFVITLPAAFGTTFTFTAHVSNITIGAMPIDNAVPFSASIAITGRPVVAITASNNATDLTVDDNTAPAVLAPVFAAGTYGYVVTMAAAAVTYHIHVTFAAGVCTITDGNGGVQTVLSTVASSEIAVTADSFHTTTVSIKETGKTAKVYTLYMLRP